MHELSPLIYDLAIMLTIAGLVVVIFQRIKQPVVLGYLVSGMIIGPYTTSHSFVTDIPNIQILSELGVIFLMFSLGLEFSFHKLTKLGFPALITGIIDVSFMTVVGYGVATLLGWDSINRLFMAAALAISSTTIIFKAIGELGLRSKRFSEVIFGVLIVEDLLAILLLVALSTIVVTKNVVSAGILYAALKLFIVVGGWFIIGYFLVPSFFRRLQSYMNQETLTIISVGLCLFLVTVAAYFHYSTALGAFIMGSILAETVLIHRIEEIIVPIRDIFGAIFFISVGMLINPSVIMQEWTTILLVTAMLMCGKVFIITLGTFLTGQSLKTAIRAGFGMAQIGEFSFIIATLGASLGVINDQMYPVIVAVSSITTFTTPYMIRLSGYLSEKIDTILPEKIQSFLNTYSTWAYRVQTSSSKQSILGSVTLRFIANAIIVVIIFMTINKYFYPQMFDITSKQLIAKILSVAIAIMLSSPFIWGMLFSYRLASVEGFIKKGFNPLLLIVWAATLIELAFLTIFFFHTWLITSIILLIVACFFAFAYKHIEISYQWFEKQLVRNIKRSPDQKENDSALSPWDIHLVEIIVGDESSFLNQTLGDLQIREVYGLNIVAIHRGHQTIITPNGKDVINDNDKLFVIGNDEQLESFRQEAILTSQSHVDNNHLSDFSLKSLLVTARHALVGKSIRESRLREKLNAIVVGIERGNSHIINPSSDMKIKVNDILLLAGEEKKLNKLKK